MKKRIPFKASPEQKPELTQSQHLDPQFNFEERVTRLMTRKNLSRQEAEEVTKKVILEKENPDIAKIRVTAKGEAYFEQGDIRFSVDPKDLNNVVGSNGGSCPLNGLMDSQIASLAQANGISIKPFSRELLLPVLVGILQITWYRDLEGYTSKHLQDNQTKRLLEYGRKLDTYKEPEQNTEKSSGVKRPRQHSLTDWTKSFSITESGKKESKLGGRAGQMLEVMKSVKMGTLAQIVEVARGKLKTKQDLEKMVTRFLKELIGLKLIEEAK